MKRFRILSTAGLALTLGIAAIAIAAAPRSRPARADAAAAAQDVRIPIEQYTLKNGLRVVLSEDHAAPTVSLCIVYDVGSRNEQPGHTGFAHLFEHMMFQGSQNVGAGLPAVPRRPRKIPLAQFLRKRSPSWVTPALAQQRRNRQPRRRLSPFRPPRPRATA